LRAPTGCLTPPIIPISSPAFFALCVACSSEHKPRVTPIIVAITRRSIKAVKGSEDRFMVDQHG